MTETWIEAGMTTIMVLISIVVGFALFRNAKAHERSVQDLDAKIKRAGINLKRS
jgi:hypothetical protein